METQYSLSGMIGSGASCRIMICERVELSTSGQLLRAHDGDAELPIGHVTLAAVQPG